MQLDPAELDPRDRYKLLVGAVVPRPIAFVSTQSPDGRANLAPFSFFNAVGGTPMTLLFCPSNNADGSEKDTQRNASSPPSGLGEFVVNLVTERYVRQAVAASEPLPHGESEFELAGLEPAPSAAVVPPRVADSPLSFECRTREIIRLNEGAPGGANIVIGDVVWVHAQDGVVDERHRVDPAKLAAVGRMAGLTYCTTRERFDVPFGRAALDARNPLD